MQPGQQATSSMNHLPNPQNVKTTRILPRTLVRKPIPRPPPPTPPLLEAKARGGRRILHNMHYQTLFLLISLRNPAFHRISTDADKRIPQLHGPTGADRPGSGQGYRRCCVSVWNHPLSCRASVLTLVTTPGMLRTCSFVLRSGMILLSFAV